MSTDGLRTALERALGAQYEIVRLLGRGGAGEVYLATERLLERPVAIKVLHRDGDDEVSRERFLREARMAARLSHPNIVPLLSFGEAGELLFYVMPFVDGESLESLLRRERQLPPSDVRRLLSDVASALAFAHQHGIVHRDVKPDNVLIARDSGRAMLTDFGIARGQGGSSGTLTRTGMIVGTPHYMSPEQAGGEGPVDGRTDLYSLGVMGYRMLSGSLPFEGRTVEELLVRHATSTPASLGAAAPDAPVALSAAIMRCLEKSPANRWPDADSMRHALEGSGRGGEELPDGLEGLPRLGTRFVGLTYLSASIAAAFYAWDYDSVWFRPAGLAVAGLGITLAVMIARARRAGLETRAAMRIAFWPWPGWNSWWPAALRSPDDVWPRLPRPLRRARALFGAAVVYVAAIPLPAAVVMLIARHHRELNALIFRAFSASALLWPLVIGVAVFQARRFGREQGLGWREWTKLLQEPNSGTKFWERPAIARLLAPASGASRALQPGPRSIDDYVRAIASGVAGLPTPVRELGASAAAAARELASQIDGIDRELRQIGDHDDANEKRRLEERLTAMGAATAQEGSAMRQMRELLAGQLALVAQLASRERELRERRASLEEHLRALWLQVARLRDQETLSTADASEITGEIRALCDSIDRRIEALIEVERVVAGTSAETAR